MDLGLCQPSTAILMISIAGAIYNILVTNLHAVMMWTLIGVFGTGIFQALCFGGLEPLAWVLMLIPVLIVCFFLAVALFASRMRINNFMRLPCRDGDCSSYKPVPQCNKKQDGCGCLQQQQQQVPTDQNLENSSVAYAE